MELIHLNEKAKISMTKKGNIVIIQRLITIEDDEEGTEKVGIILTNKLVTLLKQVI